MVYAQSERSQEGGRVGRLAASGARPTQQLGRSATQTKERFMKHYGWATIRGEGDFWAKDDEEAIARVAEDAYLYEEFDSEVEPFTRTVVNNFNDEAWAEIQRKAGRFGD